MLKERDKVEGEEKRKTGDGGGGREGRGGSTLNKAMRSRDVGKRKHVPARMG